MSAALPRWDVVVMMVWPPGGGGGNGCEGARGETGVRKRAV